MKTPFFSIVIPTLNEQKLLPRLLEDLKEQSWQDFEVIVCDGKSKDKTAQIVEDIKAQDSRFQVITCETRGVGAQRNFGAKNSSGKYLVFLDADTQLPAFFLEGLHYRFQQTPCDLFTNWAEPDGNNPRDKAFVKIINASIEGGIKMGKPVALAACIGFKQEVFQAITGFDPTVSYMEDVEIVRRAVKQGFNFVIYKDPVYIMGLRRLRKDGTLHLYRTLPNMVKQLLINQKNTEPLKSYPMLGGSYFKARRKKAGKISLLQYKEVLKLVKKMNSSRKQILQQMMQDLLS